MLAAIVTDAVSFAEDVEVVGSIESQDAIATATAREADFVVIGREDLPLVNNLLGALPAMKVLAIIGDGGDAVLYELRPQRVPLGELSPERLVAVIREGARGTTKGAMCQ